MPMEMVRLVGKSLLLWCLLFEICTNNVIISLKYLICSPHFKEKTKILEEVGFGGEFK